MGQIYGEKWICGCRGNDSFYNSESNFDKYNFFKNFAQIYNHPTPHDKKLQDHNSYSAA
jgi:hypothetical protein